MVENSVLDGRAKRNIIVFMFREFVTLLGLLGITIFSASAASPRPLDTYLRDGRIQEGLVAFASPKNNSEKFSLAVLQALDGLQQFSVDSAKLGVNQEFIRGGIPFFRMMLPSLNSDQSSNSVATPAMVADLFNNLRDSLKKANSILAGIDSKEFKVEVNLSKIRLDLNGDGIVAPDEFIISKLRPALGITEPAAGSPDTIIHFDSADAAWLKGYTHFLTGVLDILLSYNWQPVWNQCAGVVFINPKPAPPLSRYTQGERGQTIARWVDLIAALHEMRLEPVTRSGLSDARQEFKSMIICSRLCWQRVLAEDDNDHEWLPSAKQIGPGGAKITQAQIDGWLRVLDELEAVLDGKKLLPHWRIRNGSGISVPLLVASPPRLDLVLMIQGSAFLPYLEEGTVSDLATWRSLMQPYGSGFTRFAIWSQ